MSRPEKRHKLGLVVGKFSPLHIGHEHLIRQAMVACEQVLVLGYSQPVFAGCGREQRESWISRRFPELINLQVDNAWIRQRCLERGIHWQPIPENAASGIEHQTWLAWVLEGPVAMRPDAMFASEPYVFPACMMLSRVFGHTVEPVCVDPDRRAVPISATEVRHRPHQSGQWLHPDVYRDFVQRVALLGSESSGKTTLAQALAGAFETCWVAEYGRVRWMQCKGQLSLHDLLDIGRVQVEHEEALQTRARGVLFCDTSPLTTLGYARWMFNTEPEALQVLARRRYSLIVLCEPDFAFVQDGTRQPAEFRRTQHAWYEAQLCSRSEPVLRVYGSVAERVAQVRSVLSRMNPFDG